MKKIESIKEKYGFVFLLFDKKMKKFYLGYHWGNENDKFICTSSTSLYKIIKERPLDFKKRIIKKIYTNKKDFLIEKNKWLKLIKKEEFGTKYYNVRPFYHGGTPLSEKTKKKMSESIKNSPSYKEHFEKISRALKGKPKSEEHKRKISEAHKKNFEIKIRKQGRNLEVSQIKNRPLPPASMIIRK